MPKLATPLQYEPTLDGLNAIRPLQLADKVKTVIPYTVLCKNPPSIDKPAVGMFARCSQQGALLKSVPKWADSISEKALAISEAVPYAYYKFPVRIQGVLALYNELVGGGGVDWCDNNFTISFASLTSVVYTFLPFVGTDIYFMSAGYGGYEFEIPLIGFYKEDN